MAELATIARPYAEALFQVVEAGPARHLAPGSMRSRAVAGNAQMLQFAGNPKVSDQQVLDVIAALPKRRCRPRPTTSCAC